MCYAIPGKVVEVKNNIVIVDYFGERRNVLNDFFDISKGDYVYAQGGILVKKISKKNATLILNEWKDKFFDLKKVDSKLSEIKEISPIDKEFEKIIEKSRQGVSLKKEEMLRLLKTNNKNELDILFKTANKIRQDYLKNSCCVHGIIEFSNYCRNNCFYCGIRVDNKEIERYRMDVDEIVEVADYAVNQLGFKALVLQSGEDFWYTTEKLVEIIKNIKKRCGVLLFVGVGERSFSSYKKMYEAGARGILLRFETSNPKLYKKIHSGPKSDFKKRIEILKYTRKLGYIVATDSLIGLPGQTEVDLINDILLTKSLGTDMYSFGPLIPHTQTPLANTKVSNTNSVLKVIAVSRLINPDAKILITTALETLDKEGKRRGLLAGANSLMINVTPYRYKVKYSIYPNRFIKDEVISKTIEKTLQLLYSLGRAPTDLGV